MLLSMDGMAASLRTNYVSLSWVEKGYALDTLPGTNTTSSIVRGRPVLFSLRVASQFANP